MAQAWQHNWINGHAMDADISILQRFAHVASPAVHAFEFNTSRPENRPLPISQLYFSWEHARHTSNGNIGTHGNGNSRDVPPRDTQVLDLWLLDRTRADCYRAQHEVRHGCVPINQ